MKYELIGKNDFFSPIETISKNRGLENIQSLLKASEKNVIHWSKLKNIEKAVDCLLKHIELKSNIFIQVDSDPDGSCSSALLISYLTKTHPHINLQWRLQEGKEHGIIINTIPDDVNLVIVPDAGSNDYEQHSILKSRGIDVIVLDHHESERESSDAIVVNNQLSPDYENKQLSGVGITYKFAQALDDKSGLSYADNYLDLVAIGNIADSQDMRSLETRYYVNKGLKNISNKLLKALYHKQSYSTGGIINIKSTSFYINPLINACIRVGTMEEKTQMMKAFLNSDETIYYKKKDVHEPIEVSTARMLGNIKARQGRMCDKAMIAIEERIEEKNLLDNKLLIINTTDILDKNLSGLVANTLKDKYKRGALILRYNDEKEAMTGSIRGYDKGSIKDLKSFLQDTEKFDFVEGHANAAGCQIALSNLIEANDICNELLKDTVIDVDSYDVDFIFTPKQLKSNFIKEVHKYQDVWGYKVDEPMIAIKDVEVNSSEIYLNGKTAKTLKFEHKGIEYIKKFSNEKTRNELKSMGERLLIDIVGYCTVNKYMGKSTPQIVIEDFEVTKTMKKEFIF